MKVTVNQFIYQPRLCLFTLKFSSDSRDLKIVEEPQPAKSQIYTRYTRRLQLKEMKALVVLELCKNPRFLLQQLGH